MAIFSDTGRLFNSIVLTSMKKIIASLLLSSSILIVAGCGNKTSAPEDLNPIKQVSVQKLVRQNIVENTITVSGTIIPKQYSQIRSLTPGTVEFLMPVGSTVSAGQSLYRIRDANIESAFFNAQNNVNQTRVITEQRISQAELNLSSAQAALDLARSNASIARQQADLTITTAINSGIVSYNSAYTALNQVLVSLNKGDRSHGDSIYKDILTTDLQAKIDASTQLILANDNFSKLVSQANEIHLATQLDQINGVLTITKQLVDLTSQFLQVALPNTTMTQAQITVAIASINSQQALMNRLSGDIIGAQNSLGNGTIVNALNVERADNQLHNAQIQFENSEIAFANAKNSAALEQSITQSSFDTIAYNYYNLTLRSPFSGQILSHQVSAGQQVSIGQEILEIGDINIVEIKIDLDADSATALKVGDAVLIDGQYDGFITELAPSADINSGKLRIIVQANNDEANIEAGQIADIQFTLRFEVENKIIIPIRAATIQETGTTVLVIENNIAVEKTISLGQVYGNQVTVIDGLAENDQLIIPDGIFVSADDEVEAFS